jgi:hypothetical protein
MRKIYAGKRSGLLSPRISKAKSYPLGGAEIWDWGFVLARSLLCLSRSGIKGSCLPRLLQHKFRRGWHPLLLHHIASTAQHRLIWDMEATASSICYSPVPVLLPDGNLVLGFGRHVSFWSDGAPWVWPFIFHPWVNPTPETTSGSAHSAAGFPLG